MKSAVVEIVATMSMSFAVTANAAKTTSAVSMANVSTLGVIIAITTSLLHSNVAIVKVKPSVQVAGTLRTFSFQLHVMTKAPAGLARRQIVMQGPSAKMP